MNQGISTYKRQTQEKEQTMYARNNSIRYIALLAILLLAVALGTNMARADASLPAHSNNPQQGAVAQETKGAEVQANQLAAAQARTITYNYDDNGRLIGVEFGSEASIAYAYDDNGNLLSRTIERQYMIYLPLVIRNTP